MCVRILLSISLFLALLSHGFRTQAAETWRENSQLSKAYAENEEWEQAIRLLHKAVQEKPQPSRKPEELAWTGWDGYYPYLELGKAYLKIKDPFSASYYCSRSKGEGLSPTEEVKECLEAAETMLDEQYHSSVGTRNVAPDFPLFPLFPWPPPKASTRAEIPSLYLTGSGSQTLLKHAADRLEKALLKTGYAEFSYYQIPEGFALVARIEQFKADGSSEEPPLRWALEISPPRIFSLGDYLKALFTAKEGYYRIITFLVTSVPSAQAQREISQEDAIAWLFQGANVLPPKIGSQLYSEYHECQALIYEFEQETRDHEAVFKSPGRLTGHVHLTKSLLLDTLKKLSQETTP